ncbi:hypothetical protein BC827DRAFT_612043 [Russula dissimulans]|nr:hypothetical protein BC827DRAFT_111101 [Russula dissimulans]KAH9958332.1 hypothetical protein BC827DRAFT_612043 [Russula dissimulans]
MRCCSPARDSWLTSMMTHYDTISSHPVLPIPFSSTLPKHDSSESTVVKNRVWSDDRQRSTVLADDAVDEPLSDERSCALHEGGGLPLHVGTSSIPRSSTPIPGHGSLRHHKRRDNGGGIICQLHSHECTHAHQFGFFHVSINICILISISLFLLCVAS